LNNKNGFQRISTAAGNAMNLRNSFYAPQNANNINTKPPEIVKAF
jgi:hypothetical protein